MASSITVATLSLLHNELPDPDVCLYERALQVFDNFTLFPKLPIELRLLIWSHTFKPRRVVLSQRFWKTNYVRHRARATPRISMQVDKESRAFALKKYLVLLRDRRDPRRTVYFHPELDTLALPTVNIFDFEQLRGDTLLFVIGKIQRVELHKMWWDDIMTSIIGGAVNPVTKSDAHFSFYRTWITRFREELIVRQFPDLRWLGLVGNKSGRVGSLNTEMGRKECEGSFTKFMERLAVEIPGYQVPEVSVLL